MPNNYMYRGEQYDADLGLYYLRARYYNRLTGRFLSRDPEAGKPIDPKTLHKYLYASGDPVNAFDPSGREDELDYIGIITTEVIPTVIYAARLVCYTEGATLLLAQVLSYATTGHFLPGLPWPVFAAPCVAFGLPFPPSPPGGW
jgi:RHS repeat-associated protein